MGAFRCLLSRLTIDHECISFETKSMATGTGGRGGGRDDDDDSRTQQSLEVYPCIFYQYSYVLKQNCSCNRNGGGAPHMKKIRLYF